MSAHRRIVCCAAALFLLSGPARGASCRLQQIGELAVGASGNVLTVEASINGAPVRMIVDTGSAATSLFYDSAVRLGLRPKPLPNVKYYGVGGGQTLDEVFVKELKVATLVARDVELAAAGQELGGAAGLLGIGFLLQADVEFDIPDGKLRFFRAVGCSGDEVVYWGKAYSVAALQGDGASSIQADVKLGDYPVRAMMDTGASTSVVTPDVADRAGGADPRSAGSLRGIGKEAVAARVAVFPSFSFGDETIGNARLAVADMFQADRDTPFGSHVARPVDMPRMLLGADFFRSHRIYIARSQRKIYVSYVGGPVFRTRAVTPMAAPPP